MFYLQSWCDNRIDFSVSRSIKSDADADLSRSVDGAGLATLKKHA